MNNSPLSSALYNPYVVASPVSNATNTPLNLAVISPLLGSYTCTLCIGHKFVSIAD